jgi:hypothetical protein
MGYTGDLSIGGIPGPRRLGMPLTRAPYSELLITQTDCFRLPLVSAASFTSASSTLHALIRMWTNVLASTPARFACRS